MTEVGFQTLLVLAVPHSLRAKFGLQFWKSNAMYWCDYCKVWMNDNPATKATHEAGMKHKDNVARSKYLGSSVPKTTSVPTCQPDCDVLGS